MPAALIVRLATGPTVLAMSCTGYTLSAKCRSRLTCDTSIGPSPSAEDGAPMDKFFVFVFAPLSILWVLRAYLRLRRVRADLRRNTISLAEAERYAARHRRT